ncbi:hypothetical protein QPM17_20535 [Marinobacter sp. TBZ242]|uniref:Uncharacterized protein n=1 Tax=Marinobacter azerbaijanicus TaxID=3050455 RepID=A0ABT7IHB0_9GAMM|nr:hypothetical protein [Marinobacter sp. TBZ242]MDL0433536.1 hypothetical protein [Marinobacter sp. TBZ242]
MTLIALNRPVRSDYRLERVHMFPGRHLGEQELDRQQAWADARLSPLLLHRHPGIVHGLTLADESLDSVTVTPGLAVAANGRTIHLFSELKTGWQALIEQYLESVASDDATGIYYLTLSQDLRHVDSPRVEPCQRAEFDPTRDSQLVTVTTVSLRRLAIAGTAASDLDRSLIENRIAAAGVSGELLENHPDSVPVALVCVAPGDGDAPEVKWVSPEAGRYMATADSGYQVLLAQTKTAINRVMEKLRSSGASGPTEQHLFLRSNLGLDYLPAAGQLPVSWLHSPDSAEVKMTGLPEHIGLDMIPVPEDRIPDLIHRHLPSRPVNLTRPGGERLRLLLALNPVDYRPDLLDIPPTDRRLEDDLYRYQMRAHRAWMRWKSQFYHLYHIVPSHEPPVGRTEEERALERIIHDPDRLGDLGLPKAENAPVTPDTFFTELKQNQDGGSETPAYPYNQPQPEPPEDYRAWLAGQPNDASQSPDAQEPDEDGLVVRYAALLVNIEETRNQIRNLTSRGGRLRDFLLLQRQQLDVQSASLSALARGVASGTNAAKGKGALQYSYALSPDAYNVTGTRESERSYGGISKALLGSGVRKRSSMELLEKSAVKRASVQGDTLLRRNPDNTSAIEIMAQTHGQALAPLDGNTPVMKQSFTPFVSGFTVMEDASPAAAQYQKNHAKLLELNTLADQQLDKGDSKSLNKLFKPEQLVDPGKLNTEKDDTNTIIKDQYDALLDAGKALTRWIKGTESRFNRLERKREAKISQLNRLEAEAEKLSASIRIAREKLDSLAQVMDERKGDYTLAQQLLMEDWQRVQKRNEERSRILTTGIRGLWYIRVRSAEASLPAADPLALRFRQGNDEMPACDPDRTVELPESLAGFLDTVAEIPVSDWVALQPVIPRVPLNLNTSVLQQYRKIRLQEKQQKQEVGQISTALQGRLKTLRLNNRALLTGMTQKVFPAKSDSMRQTQQESARVLTLEDAISSKSVLLRKKAQELLNNLELAQSCLLQHLRGLSGSLRLTWGQLAEDDRLRVADVSRWPGLERAEKEDFNRVRTLSELVDWWFRQLDDQPASESRQAMENMIRATLIVASLGDPEDIVRGQVTAPPRLIKPGERLSVRLNRFPLPGTELQLLDELQRVSAVLAVEDQVADSTEVTITRVLQKNIRISSQSTVIGKLRR